MFPNGVNCPRERLSPTLAGEGLRGLNGDWRGLETLADILTGAILTGDILAGAICMGLEAKARGAERNCA